jgi:hypothetical protein
MPVLRSLQPPSGAARLQAFRIQAYLVEAQGPSKARRASPVSQNDEPVG